MIGLASELVTTGPEYAGLATYLLGRVLVVDHIDNAIAIARKYRHSLRMVTVEGESFSPGGSMSGGSFKNNSNLLGRRREIEELEKKVTPRTKAILIGYPNNPTGTVMDRGSLEKIADFAQKHDLVVISDEIYCDLTYEGTHTCFASLPGMKERTLTMNGFSKSYAMTGLRIGYICGPREIMEQIYKVHQYEILCASVTSQYGAIAALKYCDDDVKAMYDEYAARREMVYEGLKKIGLSVFKPKGAFYIFPDISITGMDDEEFADRLLKEEKVGVVPGSCFGPQGKNHIRISYAASRENLAEALKRIGHFVNKYRKN